MRKWVAAAIGMGAVGLGLVALPFLTVADATTDPLYGPTRPKGYQTCFMDQRAVYTGGVPRMISERRCVFAE